MGLRDFISSIFGGGPPAAPEGAVRSGPYYLPVTRGYLSAEAGQYLNWWQLGHSVQRAGPNAMVEACVAAYAQTVAMCPGNHWRLKDDGGRERIKGASSAMVRVLRKPNAYQSISDLLLGSTSGLFYDGNSYALALRNARFEITELHPMNPRLSKPLVARTGEVFYQLGGNEVVERMIGTNIVAPARDVLHVKLHTPEHPLIGVTPITAAALQAAAADAALTQQIAFFRNQSRPSFVLSTEQILTKEQASELRERWDEQAKGLYSGGTPILSAGLKPAPLGMNALDSQLIQILGLSDKGIATALRVPHVLVGLDGGSAPLGSTEGLMQFWLASGLGFVLNHTEEAWGNLFGLAGQPEEYLELDTQALLRPQYKERIEALAKSVLGGMHSPDEARNDLELGTVPGGWGAEPRVQRQVIPLSAWNTPPPTAAKAPAAETPDDGEEPDDGEAVDEIDTEAEDGEEQPERAYPDGQLTNQDAAEKYAAFDLAIGRSG